MDFTSIGISGQTLLSVAALYNIFIHTALNQSMPPNAATASLFASTNELSTTQHSQAQSSIRYNTISNVVDIVVTPLTLVLTMIGVVIAFYQWRLSSNSINGQTLVDHHRLGAETVELDICSMYNGCLSHSSRSCDNFSNNSCRSLTKCERFRSFHVVGRVELSCLDRYGSRN